MHMPMIIITNSEIKSRSCFLKIHFTVCITPAAIRQPKMNKLRALKNINTLFNSNHHPRLAVYIVFMALIDNKVTVKHARSINKFGHYGWFSKPIDYSFHFKLLLFKKNERKCNGTRTRTCGIGNTAALPIMPYISSHYNI